MDYRIFRPQLPPFHEVGDETSSRMDGGGEERPSAGSRSLSASTSTSSSDSTLEMEPRIGTSVDTLLNMSEGDECQDSRNELMDKEDQVVRMLSLHTQASHATLRPTPLDPSRGPPQSDSHIHGQPQVGGDTRKRSRGDDEQDDDEIQYQGMTPSTWKRWKESEGVKGSGYCYAYDTNGEIYRPELSFVFMLRMVIASSPRKRLSLSSIYQAIEERWPYFKQSDTTWKNSIRHCLSYNAPFVNIDRSLAGVGEEDDSGSGGAVRGGGRGGYWTLAESVDAITPPAPPPPSRATRYQSPPTPTQAVQFKSGSADSGSSSSGSSESYWRSNVNPGHPVPMSQRRSDGSSPVYSLGPQSELHSQGQCHSHFEGEIQSQSHSHQVQINPQSRPYPTLTWVEDHHQHLHQHLHQNQQQTQRPIGSSSSNSSTRTSIQSIPSLCGSYGSNASGSYMTEPDPLGLEMSKAFLAEKGTGIVPLCVDVVAPAPDQNQDDDQDLRGL